MTDKFFPWQGGVYLLVFSKSRPTGWYAETRGGKRSFGPYPTMSQAMRHIRPTPTPEKMSKKQEKCWAEIERNIKLQRKISTDNWRRRNCGIYLDEENFTFIPKTSNPRDLRKIAIDLDVYWAAQSEYKGLLSIDKFIELHPEGVIEKRPHKKRI